MFCKDCGLKKAEQAIKGQTKFCKTCGDIIFANSQVVTPESYYSPAPFKGENDIIGEITNHDYAKDFEEISEKTQSFLKPLLENAKNMALAFIEWIKRNLLVVGIGVSSVIIGLVVYKFFFAPSPEKAGKEIASMDCDCINKHKIAISENYQKLLLGFDSFKFTKRQEAYDKLQAIENPLIENYEKCKDEVNSKASKSYIDFQGTEFATFQTTYQSNSCTKRIYGSGVDSTVAMIDNADVTYSPDPMLSANPLRIKILEKIEKINDPIPTITKIKEELIGKDFNNWRISYPSEIVSLQVIKTDNDASTLRIEIRLVFEENQSKEKFNAIVNLFYNNLNGQWYFNKAEDKLFIKPEQNFYLGKQLCVVGKWRWERNYATYYPDGTWEGSWDDGTQAKGTWAIVYNSFILRTNGTNTMSGEIEDFNSKELKINFGGVSSTAQKIGQVPERPFSNLFYFYQ